MIDVRTSGSLNRKWIEIILSEPRLSVKWFTPIEWVDVRMDRNPFSSYSKPCFRRFRLFQHGSPLSVFELCRFSNDDLPPCGRGFLSHIIHCESRVVFQKGTDAAALVETKGVKKRTMSTEAVMRRKGDNAEDLHVLKDFTYGGKIYKRDGMLCK